MVSRKRLLQVIRYKDSLTLSCNESGILHSVFLINTAWRKAWEAEDPSYSHSMIEDMHRLIRKYQRAIFRFKTGHFAFKAHLFKVCKASSPVCSCGFSEQSASQTYPTGLPKPWGHKRKYMAYIELLTDETFRLTSQPRADQQLFGGC